MKPRPPHPSHEAAKAYLKAGDRPAAERMLRAITAERPDDAEAHCDLGTALVLQGKTEPAVAAYERAIALQPDLARAHGNLGNARRALGDAAGAIASYERAIAIAPSAVLWFNLGNARREAGDAARAIDCYERAIALSPQHQGASLNLAMTLLDQRRLDDALAIITRAERAMPSSIEITRAHGRVLAAMGDHEGAAAAFARGVALAPASAEAASDLGCSLLRLDRFEEACAALREAVSRGPSAAHHANLAAALLQLGMHDEALEHGERAIALDPQHTASLSNLLLAMHYAPGASKEAIFARHVELGRRFGEPAASPPRATDPEKRLRVGYLSPNLRRHSVAYFLEPLLAHHDHRALEIALYVDAASDDVTRRLTRHADRVRDVWGKSDADVARLIEGDRIDVLVDLAGHTDDHRLRVFARRAAPLQVSYLGYPDTTGLPAMDLRISDALADPPGASDPLCVERIARVPGCAWAYRPADEAPQVTPLPALARGFITFGSFNASPKLTTPWLAVWARILASVPRSRLLIKARGLADARVRERIAALFAARGVARDRLDLRGWAASPADHLAAQAGVDIALDAFPYHGTTTTCESLWMGVPVVTRAGDLHASRVGTSLLTAAGMASLIATTDDDFVRIAIDLAADRARLATLRASLRGELARSPLLDGGRLARSIEALIREAWRARCARDAHTANG